MAEQPRWVWVLDDCAVGGIFAGASLLALHQRGLNRQVGYLTSKKFARRSGGRLVATRLGRRELLSRVPSWR